MFSSDRYCLSCGAVNPPEAGVCFACGLSLKITVPLPQEATMTGRHLLQQRYRILFQIGKGGFSAVYKAEDTLFGDHPIAIKAITLSGLRPQEVIEATEAFNREVTLLTGLKHPNLPQIYNHFSDTACWYLAMDFIEGKTLEKHLETMPEARLPTGEVLEIGLMLSSVLEYLHSRQPSIIFRDVKPSNVMLTPAGGIVLIDFGIARHFKPGQARDTIPFGSPGYAAPEQYGKAQTTPRTDIYGLGALLHQLLTGNDPSQTPFRFAPLQAQDQPALSELEQLIMQMVQMDATQRPESIIVVKEELQRIIHAWSRQYWYGFQAKASPGIQRVATASWQSPQPPLQTLDAAIAGGSAISSMPGVMSMGSMAQLHTSMPGTGGTPSTYGGPPPQKKRNGMAIASISLAALSITLPFLSCVSSSFLEIYFGIDHFSSAFFIPLLVTLIPAVLAVIFGHIGKRRATTIPGLLSTKDTAATGMVIGYISGSIYLAFCLSYFLIAR